MLDLDNSPDTRRNFIGASDAPAIMGVSPWCTEYEKWEEKVGLRENEGDNWAKKWGKLKEEEARQEFERQTGLIVFPQRFVHPEHEWMVATLDGIDIERKDIVEIKCPGKIDHESAMDGVIPEKYIPQLVHQMIVMNLDYIYYFSWQPSSNNTLLLRLDSDYAKTLLDKEKAFWNNVQTFTPPSLTERDYVPKEDNSWKQTAREWLDIQAQLQALQEREEALRGSLISMSGKSNSKGGGIKLSRTLRKGHIEYKNIPELKGVDLEKYRKESSESWRIGKC